jgi:hypothetical protein
MIIILKIDVATRCNQLPRNGGMSVLGRGEKRRAPIIGPKIEVATRSNELFRNGVIL